MTITEKQEKLIKEINKFSEWFDKYEYIINLGKKLPPILQEYKTEENSISGCQSQVWLHAELKQGLLHFSADSDSMITRGLIALLINICDQESPEVINEMDFYFINEIGLNSNLSPSRANGLFSIVKGIKERAKKQLYPKC